MRSLFLMRWGAPSLFVFVALAGAASRAGDTTYGWEDITHGIHHTRLFGLGVAAARPQTLWVGAAGSLYRSDDDGETWRVVLQFSGGRTRDRIGAAVGRARRALRRDRDADGADGTSGTDRREGSRMDEKLREEVLEEHGTSVSDDELRQEDAVRGEVERKTSESRRGVAELPEKRERLLLRDKILEISVDGFYVLAATEDGLYQSRDEGLTWARTRVDTKRSNRVVTSAATTRVGIASRATHLLFAGTLAGLFVSTDAGRSFARARGPVAHLPIRRVRTDRAAPGEAWVATIAGLWHTGDGGQNWARRWFAPGAAGRVSDVAIDGARIWIATDGGLYQSRDGRAFQAVTVTGAGSPAVHRVAVHPRAPTLVAAATRAIFLSHDGGKTWSDIAYGLPARRANDIACDAHDPRSFTVTTDAGVFRRVVEEPGIVTPSKLQSLRRRLAADPSATRVLAQVFASWGLNFNALRRAGNRARLAAALPRLTAALSLAIGDRGSGRLPSPTDDFLSSDFETWDDALLDLPSGTVRTENRSHWEVFARWDLRRIIFPDEETDVLRAERELLRKRQKLADRVLAVYQTRRDVLVRTLVYHPKRWRTVLRRELQLARLTAELDAYTDGLFSKDLEVNMREQKAERSNR